MKWNLDSFLYEMKYHWPSIDHIRMLVKSDLIEAGFDQHTFKSNLQPKLDRLMTLLVGRIEMHSRARQYVEECLILSGVVDMYPVEVNSLKNLAYLAVAQSCDFKTLNQITRSHADDYAECEEFLTRRNDLIRKIISFGTRCEVVVYGGLCRDTIKGGLCRHQDGHVPRDVDLHFESSADVHRFVKELRQYYPQYHLSESTFDYGYGNGYCEKFRVYLTGDTTISVAVDCAYPGYYADVAGFATESIDFNVNALEGYLRKNDLFYAVREGLRDVPGLTLPEILSDIEQKQFKAIGILKTQTPLSHKVFTDPTAHVCCHRYKSDAQKLRKRADSLIARGWKLITTCDNPECWLGSKEKFDEIKEQLRIEQERLRVERYLYDQEQLRLGIEERERYRVHQMIIESEDLEESAPLCDHKARGSHHWQIEVKHKLKKRGKYS